jgi:hypothetical protein
MSRPKRKQRERFQNSRIKSPKISSQYEVNKINSNLTPDKEYKLNEIECHQTNLEESFTEYPSLSQDDELNENSQEMLLDIVGKYVWDYFETINKSCLGMLSNSQDVEE